MVQGFSKILANNPRYKVGKGAMNGSFEPTETEERLNENDDENENIDEELEEKSLSKQKKMNLMSQNAVGRGSNRQYNFTNPTADLE